MPEVRLYEGYRRTNRIPAVVPARQACIAAPELVRQRDIQLLDPGLAARRQAEAPATREHLVPLDVIQVTRNERNRVSLAITIGLVQIRAESGGEGRLCSGHSETGRAVAR